MNKTKTQRLIVSNYNHRTRKYIIDKRKYTLHLNKLEIGILKAALQYWLLDNDYGYALWDIQSHTYGSSDTYYRKIVSGTLYRSGLFGALNNLSSGKPLFSEWCDIERIENMCKKDVEEYESNSKEEEYEG